MSKLETNTIEPISGSTTLTLGASGDTLTFPSGVLTSTNNNFSAFAHFMHNNGDTTVADSTSDGIQHSIQYVDIAKNITVSTTNNNWTHAKTGYYNLFLRYRQNSGGDVWTVYGILKGGNSGTCVGASTRTGSEDSINEGYSIFYKVDSTTATYQVNGWNHSGTKIVDGDFNSGKPGWSGYDDVIGTTGANAGIAVDYIITRVGDL